jgi:hypothetical protein
MRFYLYIFCAKRYCYSGYKLSGDLRNEIVNAKRGRGTGREARDQPENVLGFCMKNTEYIN